MLADYEQISVLDESQTRLQHDFFLILAFLEITEKERYQKAFGIMDKDGDGKLTADDLKPVSSVDIFPSGPRWVIFEP